MPIAHLPDRAVVRVAGEGARDFLDNLLTCSVADLGAGEAHFGALLTPQGKIVADFIATLDGTGEEPAFLLDTGEGSAASLIQRLSLYKLRAKVTVEDASDRLAVLAGWADAAPPTRDRHLVVPDPRLFELGWRAIVPRDGLLDAGSPEDSLEAYRVHVAANGVPESGRDYAYGETFPHEALMDQLGGVDFKKGCYVGQEVVSRMQHRGTARTRIVRLEYPEGEAAEPGTELTAGDKSLGRSGSRAGALGLAMIRLDRASDALAAGEPITADGRAVRFAKPGWVRFAYPGEAAAERA